MTDGSPACARSALRASGYRASATFGDGLADDRRRGAGRSRSRPQDSHGQEQTCRAGGAVGRTRIRAGRLQRPGQAVYPGQGRRSARHQDHTRESFRRAASGTAQAELVALWIGQDVPVLVPWPTSTCRAPRASSRSSSSSTAAATASATTKASPATTSTGTTCACCSSRRSTRTRARSLPCRWCPCRPGRCGCIMRKRRTASGSRRWLSGSALASGRASNTGPAARSYCPPGGAIAGSYSIRQVPAAALSHASHHPGCRSVLLKQHRSHSRPRVRPPTAGTIAATGIAAATATRALGWGPSPAASTA